ncbi:hypothetical protein [Campylobacter ureolyticus]|uniref:hypothetical protein n=1 Tax=Campylobacter ureolyticus TaxID=827 RepID=UPI0022B43FF6|nr:hypothetical protein [Campylobacter ureolyticus]MCZ6174776.1 hypothetical protein [Campylobacter ureolyticus]
MKIFLKLLLLNLIFAIGILYIGYKTNNEITIKLINKISKYIKIPETKITMLREDIILENKENQNKDIRKDDNFEKYEIIKIEKNEIWEITTDKNINFKIKDAEKINKNCYKLRDEKRNINYEFCKKNVNKNGKIINNSEKIKIEAY